MPDRERKPFDQLLYFIYALLGLAVVIAFLGIVNTLALSVHERTPRGRAAAGCWDRSGPLRTMLILESVPIALLGGLVGVALGVA